MSKDKQGREPKKPKKGAKSTSTPPRPVVQPTQS